MTETRDSVEVAILRHKFDDLLREGGFTDSSVILEAWKKEGLLNHEDGHLTRQRTLQGIRQRMYVVRLPKATRDEESEEFRSTSLSAVGANGSCSSASKLNPTPPRSWACRWLPSPNDRTSTGTRPARGNPKKMAEEDYGDLTYRPSRPALFAVDPRLFGVRCRQADEARGEPPHPHPRRMLTDL